MEKFKTSVAAKDEKSLNDCIDEIIKAKSSQSKKLIKEFTVNAQVEENIHIWLQDTDLSNEPICKLFYHWYQSDKFEFQVYVLRYFPLLLWIYQNQLLTETSDEFIEAVLLVIYNTQVTKNRTEKIYVAPHINRRSVYHIPTKKLSSGLTESALTELSKQLTIPLLLHFFFFVSKTIILKDKFENIDPVIIEPSLPSIEIMSSLNRNLILKCGLEQYVDNIDSMPFTSLHTFCYLITKIVSQGYPFCKNFDNIIPFINSEKSKKREYRKSKLLKEENQEENQDPSGTQSLRIPIDTNILQVFVNGIKYCLFEKETQQEAEKALDFVHIRSSYDLIPEVLLSTNCLFHLNEYQW